MKFTVLWTPAAEQELARLWLDAANRSAISFAAQVIDRNLHADPEQAGESRPGGRRMLLAAPLGVLFRVNRDDAMVHVTKVWRFNTHDK